MLLAFYIFSALAVLGAAGLVFSRSPVHGALSLVGCMAAIAVIFLLLNNEFIAAIQIIVYAGAIMVLFLFVIMLLNLRDEGSFAIRWNFPRLCGALLSLALLAQLSAVFANKALTLGPSGDYVPARIAREGAVGVIGKEIFTRYVLPFEVVAILLMIGVMGAVVLAKRR